MIAFDVNPRSVSPAYAGLDHNLFAGHMRDHRCAGRLSLAGASIPSRAKRRAFQGKESSIMVSVVRTDERFAADGRVARYYRSAAGLEVLCAAACHCAFCATAVH